MPAEFARHLGTASVTIALAVSLWVLNRTPITKGTSLSEHIGREHHTYLVFAMASTLSYRYWLCWPAWCT